MTTRQILDRAVDRALHKDIRLAGIWEPLYCAKGNEAIVASEIASLARGRVDEEKLVRVLKDAPVIEDILQALDAEQVQARVNFETESLFSQTGAF